MSHVVQAKYLLLRVFSLTFYQMGFNQNHTFHFHLIMKACVHVLLLGVLMFDWLNGWISLIIKHTFGIKVIKKWKWNNNLKLSFAWTMNRNIIYNKLERINQNQYLIKQLSALNQRKINQASPLLSRPKRCTLVCARSQNLRPCPEACTCMPRSMRCPTW